MGAVATRGAAWGVGMTVLGKFTGIGGQLLLAWLLTQEDFGLYALAMTFPAVGGVLMRLGVRQVLVNRQKRWHLWVNPSFWISAVAAWVGLLITLALCPVAMWMYGEGWKLAVLMMCVSGAAFATALGTVAEARLQVDLRFRAVAVLGWLSVVGAMVLSVGMAWGGWGALSFGIPYLLAAVFRTGGMWWMTRPKIRWRLEVRRWRYLLADTGYLTASQALWSLTQRADFLVLGLLYSTGVVGVYSFAFNLSIQTVQMLVTNLQNVMFAALNKLKDEPARQAEGFLRASRVLLMAGAAMAMMQAAAAKPAILLMFQDKWVDAIGIVQLLSAGSVLGLMYGPGTSLLEAQGRFRLSMWMTGVCAAILVVAVGVGAWWGAGMGAAVGVVVYWGLTGVLLVKVGLGARVGWWGRGGVVALFGVPLSLGLVAGAAGYAATWMFAETRAGHAMACVAVVVVTGGVFVGLARWWARAWYDELMGVVVQLVGPGVARFRR